MKVGKTFLKSKMMAIVALFMMAIISFSFGFGLIGYSKVSKAASITPIEGECDYVDALRYGYNVTAGKPIYDDGLNIANPILEPISERLYAYIAKTEMNTKTESGHHVETSAVSIAKQLTTNTTGGIEAKVAVVNTNIDTVFDRSNASTEAYSEQYETYYQNIKRISYVIQGNVDLRNYLAKDFKDELYSIKNKNDALYMLKKYGTHLFTGFDYGGMLEVTNFIQTKSSSVDLSQMDSLSTKMGIAMGSYGAGVSFSFSEQFASSEQKEFGVSNYKANIYGGESVAALTIDQLFTYNSSLVDGNGNYVYDRWVKSINEKKSLAIIGTPGSARNIPLWELVDDKLEYYNIKNCLQVAYAELCGDEYLKYLEKYPTMQRSIAEGADEKGVHGVEGYSLLHNNNVSYYESADDSGENKVFKGSTIYMNFFPIIPNGRVFEWKIVNGDKYASIVDAKRGIVKVETGADVIIGSKFTVALCSNDDILYSQTFKVIEANFSGGEGTEERPYLISTVDDFWNFTLAKDYWGSHFRLTNDLDLTGIELAGVGGENNAFLGVFDGANHTIFNVRVKNVMEKSIGLFSYNEGTIKNLFLDNVMVTNSDAIYTIADRTGSNKKSGNTGEEIKYAGGLVACNRGGTITNCKVSNVSVQAEYSTSTVDGRQTFVGGLVGYSTSNGATFSSIEECSVINASVYAIYIHTKTENTITTSAGGLVGYANSTTINDVYVEDVKEVYAKAQANVPLTFAGGLVGGASGNVTIESAAVISFSTIQADKSNNNNGDSSKNIEKEGILLAYCEEDGGQKPTVRLCIAKSDSSGTLKAVTDTYVKWTDRSTATKESHSFSSDVKLFEEVIYNSSAQYYLSPKKWTTGSNGKPVLKNQNNESFSVFINTDNALTSYYYGESFTIAGVTVKVINNVTNEEMQINEFSFNASAYNANTIGVYDIIVTALGIDKVYKVSVRNIEVVGLALEYKQASNPIVGQKPSLDDYDIYYVLESGEKINVNDEKVDYINYPKKSIKLSTEEYVEGENLVKATCGELSGSIIVEAEKEQFNYLTINESTDENNKPKQFYAQDTFSLEGYVVKAIQTDAEGVVIKEKDVDISEIEIFASVLSEGENEIIISYGDYVLGKIVVTVLPKVEGTPNIPSGGNSGSETPSNPSEGQGGSGTLPPSSNPSDLLDAPSTNTGSSLTNSQEGSLSTVESILMIVGIIALVGAVIFVVKRLFFN